MASSPSFGALLEHHLERLGLTKRAFAKRVGVSHTYVNQLIAGKRRLAQKRLEAWAERLELRGDEREAFIEAGLIEHTPEPFRPRVRRILKGPQAHEHEARVAEPDEPRPTDPRKPRRGRLKG